MTTQEYISTEYQGGLQYIYTAGNPVMLMDPDGRDWINDKDGNYSYSYYLNKDGSVTDTRGKSYDAGYGEISGAWTKVRRDYIITNEINAGVGASVIPLIGFGGNQGTISR